MDYGLWTEPFDARRNPLVPPGASWSEIHVRAELEEPTFQDPLWPLPCREVVVLEQDGAAVHRVVDVEIHRHRARAPPQRLAEPQVEHVRPVHVELARFEDV